MGEIELPVELSKKELASLKRLLGKEVCKEALLLVKLKPNETPKAQSASAKRADR